MILKLLYITIKSLLLYSFELRDLSFCLNCGAVPSCVVFILWYRQIYYKRDNHCTQMVEMYNNLNIIIASFIICM